MPRVTSQRKNCTFCKTIGCTFFTKDTHCHGCKTGLTKRQAQYKRVLNKIVRNLTKGSNAAVGDTVLETLSNLRKKDTLLRAKDIIKFCKGSYENAWWHGNPELAQPLDKLLMRVVDYWELHQNKGINGTIHCYWNPIDDYKNLWEQLYARRLRILARPGLQYLLKTKPSLFLAL